MAVYCSIRSQFIYQDNMVLPYLELFILLYNFSVESAGAIESAPKVWETHISLGCKPLLCSVQCGPLAFNQCLALLAPDLHVRLKL